MKQFLESEIPTLPASESFFHVIPAPMEQTVSYGSGTANGPMAILEASDQLEAFDGTTCPCERGIHTTKTALTLEEIENAVSTVWSDGKFPFVLGGEHTVTLGALRALKAAGEVFGVIQFDAHADLRDEYEGSALSHACVMRRAIDDLGLPLFQIGVRALSLEEHQLRTDRQIPHLDAVEIARDGLPETLLPPDFPEKVYVTFDVDGLDPSAMPSTGTPVPNGLSWRESFQCLDKIAAERKIIAADVVELAPVDGFPASDFGAAQLAYKMMGLAWCSSM
jgi:agmatinase